MTDKDYKSMLEEYKKGGKFTEFVNKAIRGKDITVEQQCLKEICFEYYKSVTVGCNK